MAVSPGADLPRRGGRWNSSARGGHPRQSGNCVPAPRADPLGAGAARSRRRRASLAAVPRCMSMPPVTYLTTDSLAEGVGASQVLSYVERLADRGLEIVLHTFEKAAPPEQ